MHEEFKLVSRTHRGSGCNLEFLHPSQVQHIRRFHESFPMYVATPLAHLPQTAK